VTAAVSGPAAASPDRRRSVVRTWLPWILVLGVVVGVLVAARDSPSDSADARTDRIAGRLKCPDCLALSVQDSDTDAAKAIRTQIRTQVDGGASDAEILRYFADTYGNQILLKPESSGIGTLVWALPIGAVVVAACGLGLAVRRWRRDPARTPTAEDRRIVDRFRQDDDREDREDRVDDDREDRVDDDREDGEEGDT
jgi:cytochrome c-type biogenesis protein CcmH